uniref:RNA polymerase sigma-70 factor, ECF subfamily n=2 Tax=Candidatus Bipolaricaulota TaxID=67810 RepID=H5SQ91_ACEAU|nr:RNA polymerase sigma-70 factor, ECF subfamily [Candidatus Acetothermum autotrophicum]
MNRVTGDMAELLRRVREGDRAAWAQFYEEFKREVIGVCMAILHNEHEALDAAEETFLKVFSRCAELDPDGNARGWLLKIAANVCKDKLRRERSRMAWLSRWKISELSRWRRNPVETQVRQDFRGEAVQKALTQLDEKYRRPLVLRFYADLDYAQIAEILHEIEGEPITETTVGTRIHRAKEQLRALLQELL